MTALSSLTFQHSSSPQWVASENVSGFSKPITNQNQPSKVVLLGNSVGNTTAGGADEMLATTLTITASGTATVNLSSFTDVCNQATVSFARVKGYRIWLQSLSDSSSGTACTGITVGNAGSNPFLMNGWSAAATSSFGNGEYIEWWSPNATGKTVSGSNCNVLITNTDSSHSAVVQVLFVGGST